jgi:hypothetical protein
MDEKSRKEEREMTPTNDNHQLWCNITFHEQGTKPTKHRTIKQRGLPTRQHKTDDGKQALLPFKQLTKAAREQIYSQDSRSP